MKKISNEQLLSIRENLKDVADVSPAARLMIILLIDNLLYERKNKTERR